MHFLNLRGTDFALPSISIKSNLENHKQRLKKVAYKYFLHCILRNFWGHPPLFVATMTADVVPRMEAASPALNLPSAAKLRPSPAVPGSMESAIKMWLQVGNVQKLQQVSLLSKFYGYSEYRASIK